jgi:hypothetical protein
MPYYGWHLDSGTSTGAFALFPVLMLRAFNELFQLLYASVWLR